MGTAASTTRMTYVRARNLLLTAGFLVLAILAGYQWVTARNFLEVAGTLLFVPVFVAFVFWGVAGGAAAAVLAVAGYAGLYSETIAAIGFGELAPRMIGRGISYLLFGVLGGWGASQIKTSLDKLDVHDQIDDSTGLFNARFFVHDTDLELSRAKRYGSSFGTAVIDVPGGAFETMSGKARAAALREVGRIIKDSVRSVDRPVYADTGKLHRFAVVLPETPREGAQIFVDRVGARIADSLVARGAPITPEQIGRVALAYPADESLISELREDFSRVDAAEHPKAG